MAEGTATLTILTPPQFADKVQKCMDGMKGLQATKAMTGDQLKAMAEAHS